jgi:hypothetical protein
LTAAAAAILAFFVALGHDIGVDVAAAGAADNAAVQAVATAAEKNQT